MPNNLVKTPEDEKHWKEAKQLAKKEGKLKTIGSKDKGNWAYVVRIYENLKGGKKK